MERVHNKEEQKQEQNNTKGINLIQMATIVGNQAVIQRVEVEEICTPGFISKHFDGTTGGIKETFISKSVVISDYEKWKTDGYPTYNDPRYGDEYVLFTGVSGNVYGVKEGKINHYAGSVNAEYKAAEFSSYKPGQS